MSDQELSDLERLGASLLDASLLDAAESTGSSHSSSFSEPLYLRAVQLASVLKSHGISSLDDSLSSQGISEIMEQISSVVDSLPANTRPSPDLGTGLAHLEAFRVMCFSLLAVQRSLAAENRALQDRLDAAQDSAKLIAFLRQEFDLSHSSPQSIIKELRQKRDAPDDSKSRIRRLAKQVEALKSSNEQKDHEIEQLRASISTPAAENDMDARVDKAFAELSDEMRKMSAELAAESRHKLELVELVHKQSVALSLVDRQLQTPRNGPVRPDLVAVLRTSVSATFFNTDLGSDVLQLLKDPKTDTTIKCRRMMERIKQAMDNQRDYFSS
jgi:hypothetical protein